MKTIQELMAEDPGIAEALREAMATRYSAWEMMESLKQTIADTDETIASLLQMVEIKSIADPELGGVTLAKTSPRKTFDKNKLQVALLEKGVGMHIVKAAMEAATGMGKAPEKEYVVKYSPPKGKE